MKSLMVFAKLLLEDLGARCSVDTIRDFKTVSDRVEHEGEIPFLGITLAGFGKSFEKSLRLGYADRNHFEPCWAWRGGVPTFMSGFLGLVFDSRTGMILDNPSIAAIHAVRQFTLAFAKIGVDCSNERVEKAKKGYIECELEVRSSDQRLSAADQLDFSRMANRLWGHSLSIVDQKIYNGEVVPKHGPGATADRLMGNQKYDMWEYAERLDDEFPFVEFARWSYSQALADLPHVDFREPGNERPVRVITVPKTVKTPRIIAIEPSYMQYIQQAIQEAMAETFRRIDFPSAFICYDSQIPNQEMARRGSLPSNSEADALATLDLSEASDRVSNQLVKILFANYPHLNRAVQASRSRFADVDGHVIELAKFASMGSALCFPVEALVFCTVVFLGIQRANRSELSKDDIRSFFGRVRVYGDDIIVPNAYAVSVKETLELFGFKVNADKSFWTGMFRESCGKDYYSGYDVSIVRVRAGFPDNRQNAKELVSTVSLRNQLAKAGFSRVVMYLDELLSRIIPMPNVTEDSPVLGKHVPAVLADCEKMCPDLHVPLVKGVIVKAKLPGNAIDGEAALLKWRLKRGDEPFADVEHLLRSGRPVIVNIKYGWARSR